LALNSPYSSPLLWNLRAFPARRSCANTDNSTAQAALAGLVDFFQNKFPSLAANEFYITGESYAGVYVPTLSRAILDHNDGRGLSRALTTIIHVFTRLISAVLKPLYYH
jgi:carboxypeptidase C (cathepsin A)